MTLPTISPVLLFAVVLGVIQGLQYFTQAFVAANVAAGQASQGGSVSTLELGYPEGSTLFYPVLLYYHGFRFFNMGYASAMAVLLLVVAFAATTSSSAAPAAACTTGRRDERRASTSSPSPCAASRRARSAGALLVSIADHSLLIVARGRVPRPRRLHRPDIADDDDQALSAQLWPSPFAWHNYVEVFSSAPIWRWALNSFIYASLATLGLLISSIPVAYAFSRLRWRGRDWVFLVVLVALMLPPQVTVVPLYVMWAKLHLVGTLWPLIIPNWFGDAFAIFLLRQFFLTIPEEYLDAARVDGCGEFRILTSVVLRLAKPAIAAVALFSILYTWNDFFLPLLYVGENPDHWVASIGLAQFRNLHQVQWNLTMAATLLVMLPVVIVFFLAQKAFVEGVTLTGVKG